MSTGPEPSTDLVAVACVVDSSLLLASEWSRVLVEYVYPLLRRLNELHPSHQFRLAFVTYAAADTRPRPLLSRRFFAPLSLVTRELREEPSKLGIGQTNSGGGRGLSALEGLVAAIEFFDILMASTNSSSQTQSPQKEGRSLISHLLHIAASPPDNVQRPQWNTLQHLDSVNWDSLPSELRKARYIPSGRPVPKADHLIEKNQLEPHLPQENTSVSGSSIITGPGAQSPWFNVHSPHVLLLAGFPTPQKTGTKRQTDAILSDQSPDAKRQKVVADPITKTSSASPALPPARIPQNQRSQPTAPSQPAQPAQPAQPPPPAQPATTVSSQNPSSAQSAPATSSAPVSTSTSPSGPLPTSGTSHPAISSDILDQVVTSTGLKFGQMMERLKALERDIGAIDMQITNAQNTGQAAILAALQKDRGPKINLKEQIKLLLRQHYQKIITKEALNVQAGTSLPDGSVEAPPSAPPTNTPSTSSERALVPPVEEQKPVIPDSQVLVQQFWQSRGGTVSAPNTSSPLAGPSPSQIPSHLPVTPEMAAQMQKPDKRGIRSQTFPSASQASGAMSQETVGHPNATNNQPVQVPNVSAPPWLGTFSWTFPKFGTQAAIEVQIHMIGMVASDSDVPTNTWPTNLVLNPCKEPLKDNTQLPSWLKRHQARAHLMQFKFNPRVPDATLNEQKFNAVYKFMVDRHVYAYAGWQQPSGKFSYNILIFPMRGSFAGAVFHEGLPDLPGGNTLEGPSSIEEAKPRLSNGPSIPPALLARMQALDPARQAQFLTQIMRAQQDHVRRQQLQQSQQSHNASSQVLNSLGVPHSYGTVTNIPANIPANVNGPTNSGAYNPGGGTVNYEMLQSFMQRNAEGSTSQGMNPG